MKIKTFLIILSLSAMCLLPSSTAVAETYRLHIARKPIKVAGTFVEKITVNGTIPGPILRFTEGEDVRIEVTNDMTEDTSIHWHGLLLPGEMDGVPGLNGFQGIAPGTTFNYHFKIRQAGTYWYHAHSIGQEQDGLYGAIVITPKHPDAAQSDRDYVVLLSDFAAEESTAILANLKMRSDYYNFAQRTLNDFFADIRKRGFGTAVKEAAEWGGMRMSATDLSDVSGYTFLMNGKSSQENWTGLFKPGEKVRLRFINASAMSIYDVRIPGLKMRVVQADGQNVEPVTVDEFRFGVAETYDVIVEPREDKAYTIAAEPIDRTGFALGTLATQEGARGEVPEQRSRVLLSMGDMGMSHGDHSGHDMSKMNHAAPGNKLGQQSMREGWADHRAAAGTRILDYKDLRFLGTQNDLREPGSEIAVRLGGNMERYIWTINGKKHEDAKPIRIGFGERVRFKFVNETMMAHPMHLHGMFVQLENGQALDKLPNKHTLIVPPGQSTTVLLTANEPGEWAFHCHLLYHMLSGMMTTVIVTDETILPVSPPSSEGAHHHDH